MPPIEEVTSDERSDPASPLSVPLAGLAAVTFLAAAARVVQYLSRSSMSLDELALTRNVASRSLSDLIGRPLDYDQVAPVGFLAVQKLLHSLLGSSELVFRLLPLVASLALFAVFAILVRNALDGRFSLAACGVLAVAYGSVSYAATAKQYSSDMLAVTTLVTLALILVERGFQRSFGLKTAGAGALLILLSLPAVPVAGALGLVLAAAWLRQEKPRPAIGLGSVAVAWGGAAGLHAMVASRGVSPETRAYMKDFWSSGFVPWDAALPDLLSWLPTQLVTVFDLFLLPDPSGHVLEQALLWSLTVLVPIGAVDLARRTPWSGAFLLCPLIVGIALASARVLPFEERSALYAAPVLLILSFRGAAALAGLAARGLTVARGRLPAFGAVALAVASTLPIFISPPPWSSQHIRPVLQEMLLRMEEGDRVYAFYGAGQALAWYGPQVGLPAWVQGECHRGDIQAYFQELDAFRGASVWVAFTHARRAFDEVGPMTAYLEAIGTRTATIEDPDGNKGAEAAFAYRFDLTDLARLASTTAETFVVVSDFQGRPEEACTGPAARF